MADIYEEFQLQLAGLSQRFSGNKERELSALFLLALEREQIVTVAYRESLIADRLNRMQIPPDVRKIIQHALAWAWKDEEMHAIYIRGALLRTASLTTKFSTFLTQAAGAIGGWAGSVSQHARWTDAPLSKLAASAFTAAGILARKVPNHVRKYLNYSSFRDFCLFNADAEKTAWLCWHRIAELACEIPGFPAESRDDFQRIEQDELQHGRLFQIICDSLNDDDTLIDSESVHSLVEKIGAINEAFLPRLHRSVSISENPLGTGGKVFVTQAHAGVDKRDCFSKFLDQSNLRSLIFERAKFLNKPVEELRIVIKPTFMMGYSRKDASSITCPELLNELARYLRGQGCTSVEVIEGPNIYDKFYRNRSVREVANYFSISSSNYSVVDVSEDQCIHKYGRGLAQYSVSKAWKDADFRISFGKMRSHPVEIALLTIGNLEGIGKRCEEFLFVERQAHRETAVMTLVNDFPPHFAILDAFHSVPDGILGVMGCPKPKTVGRFYGGADALAIDTVAGKHLGMKSPHQSSLLQAAHHWFGDSNSVIEVEGNDENIQNWRSPYHNEFTTFLCFLAYPVYVLGSFRGSLFVPEMDEEAFPPVQAPSVFLKSGRRILQAFLGLRFKRGESSISRKDAKAQS